jgi:CBS domain-containing protein
MRLSDVWKVMSAKTLRHIPVVEGGNLLVGMLAERELLRLGTPGPHGTHQLPDMTVGEAMERTPHHLPPTASAADIARACRAHHVDAMPITDSNGQLLGLVTSSDLLDLVVAMELGPLPMTFRLHDGGSSLARES